ncbi:MAG: sigma-54-dependent transcriptional regulator [Myxococcota bacterium]
MPSRILVVEDDSVARQYLELLLRDEGFETAQAADGVEALVALESGAFDLLIADLRMPRMDGIELVSHVRQRWPELPVVVVTADSEVSRVVEAVQLGAVNYLVKPVPPAAVRTAVYKAISLRTSPPSSDGRFPEIVGASHAIVEVRHRVALAGRSDVPVLITGETGTGKELVARAIHRTSSLSAGPFVAHNCALAPLDLFESEFFGHHKGAFTGADRDHTGLLRLANGGVLFLDELEALAATFQAKLLRVLDDGEVRPVGSELPEQVSVRFLAATNRDPIEMIRTGSLREDLYYRLRGFEIHLPPLRERAEDIPRLALHLLGEDSAGFEPDAMEALTRWPWPGNVRELENAVRTALSAAAGARIGLRHLSLASAPTTAPGETSGSGTVPSSPPGRSLRDIERGGIIEALQECDGNRTHAARRLGINRSTLRRKIRDLGLEPTQSH